MNSIGDKFKKIAQGYTLDILLSYANKHLQELSRRYVLQRIPDTLGLQISDLDMGGEIRSVHSLSGGESFLISLALALGLSSVSSNRMQVESLFIDEGFGSLDIDTLRIANRRKKNRCHITRARNDRTHRCANTSRKNKQRKKQDIDNRIKKR